MKALRTVRTTSPMRRVVANTGWNLGGSALPLVAGLFAIPVLIRQIGTDRFGVLMLAWALIGYMGLLDFGLGRAVTKFAADREATGASHEIPAIFWDAVWALAALGVVGGAGLAALARPIAATALHVPAHLRAEVTSTVYVIAITVPLVTVTTGVRAVLEAQQRFAGINVVRSAAGVLGFALPVALLPYSCRLDTLVATLAGLRLLMLLSLWVIATQSLPGLSCIRAPRTAGLKSLLCFGGWVTISNVVSPVLVYMDRFLIAAIASVGAVAYYATPHEMVTKLLMLPFALQTAVFPALSGSIAARDSKTVGLYKRTIELIVVALLPTVLLVIALSQWVLSLWLGTSFASHSFRVAQILALGVFINGVAHVPAALLQGSGRPDLCAKLHLIELPCYAVLCWALIRSFGIEGAAWAWVFRVSLDAALLLYMARGWVPRWPWGASRTVAVSAALLGSVTLVLFKLPLAVRASYLVVVSAIVFIVAFGRHAHRVGSTRQSELLGSALPLQLSAASSDSLITPVAADSAARGEQ